MCDSYFLKIWYNVVEDLSYLLEGGQLGLRPEQLLRHIGFLGAVRLRAPPFCGGGRPKPGAVEACNTGTCKRDWPHWSVKLWMTTARHKLCCALAIWSLCQTDVRLHWTHANKNSCLFSNCIACTIIHSLQQVCYFTFWTIFTSSVTIFPEKDIRLRAVIGDAFLHHTHTHMAQWPCYMPSWTELWHFVTFNAIILTYFLLITVPLAR